MKARWAGRLGAIAIGIVGALLGASVAFAHVDVEADPDVAGSTDAVITFTAEAESASAGITSVRVVLPLGLAPQDVALNKAPEGWRFTTTPDGYSVGGTALPPGEEAVHSIIVTRLPQMNQLILKTLVTYSDGSVDRWIEEKSAGNPNPENPAPVLTLRPGPSATPTTAAPTASLTPRTAATTPAAAPADGGSGWLWWVLGAVVVILATAGLLLSRRRRGTTPS